MNDRSFQQCEVTTKDFQKNRQPRRSNLIMKGLNEARPRGEEDPSIGDG